MPVSTRTLRALHPAVRPAGRPLTAEDLWRLPRVGTAAPAPDGAWAVVPVTTYDLEKNEGKTRLWMVSATGAQEPRALTSPDSTSTAPRVSPDGTRLAFLRRRDKSEKAQLHILPLDGGEAEKVTDLPLGVADPRWFADGRRIAFLAPLLAGHLTAEQTKARLEEREKDPVKAHVTEHRVYRFWDTWLDGGEVPHLFVLDLETHVLKDVTPASTRWFELMDPEGQYDISPDGSEIAFSANTSEGPHRRLRWGIHTVPVAGGEVCCLTEGSTGEEVRPRYSKDGTAIVYGMQRDPDFYADRVRLARYDRKAGTHTVLTEDWDRSASGWEFDETGRLVFLAEDRARVCVFALPASGGTPALLHEGGAVSGLAVSRGRLWFTRQTLTETAELWTADPAGKAAKAVTRFTEPVIGEIALGEVQEVDVEGARGETVQAFVVFPPGFDPKQTYPLVHVIHGGPHGISGDQFHPRWNGHLFAAPGYIVAMVNFHGSTSWGQDYAQCIQGHWGEYPMADIEAATDALLATGFVDEKAMAITGGSYGGYLVSWISAHTNRYACVVNHAGVYNTQSQYASDVTQGRHRAFGGEPWDGIEAIDRWNPARFASGVNTPTLVIHGENDFRVPVDQGLECYNVLQGKGVPARLVYFPDENHWVLKPRNSVFWYREVHEWLARWLNRA
ncbi:MAG: S9 family peptidase [Candidatus Eisenbacteria bacterium]